MDAKSEAYLGPYQTIKAGTYSYMKGKTNTPGIMILLCGKKIVYGLTPTNIRVTKNSKCILITHSPCMDRKP